MSNKIPDQHLEHLPSYSALLLLVSHLSSQAMPVLSQVQDIDGYSS